MVTAFTVEAITLADPTFTLAEQTGCTSIAEYIAAAQAAAEAQGVELESDHYQQLLQKAVEGMYADNEAALDAELKVLYETGKWPVCLADAPCGIGKDGIGNNLYGEILWNLACEQAAKKDWSSDQVEERRVVDQGFRIRPKATGASAARRDSLHATLQQSLTGSKVYSRFRVTASDRPGEYTVDLVRKADNGHDRVCMCPVWQGKGAARVNRGYVSMRLRRNRPLTLAQAQIIVAQPKASGMFVRGQMSPPIFAKDFESFANLYQAVKQAGFRPTVRDQEPYCDWLLQIQQSEKAKDRVAAVDADDLTAWDEVDRPVMQAEIAADQRELAVVEQQLKTAQKQLTALETQINQWLEDHKAEALAGSTVEDFAKDIKQLDTLPLSGPTKPHRAEVLAVLDGQVGGTQATDAYQGYQQSRAQVMRLELQQQKFKDREQGFKHTCPRVWESCAAEARKGMPGYDSSLGMGIV